MSSSLNMMSMLPVAKASSKKIIKDIRGDALGLGMTLKSGNIIDAARDHRVDDAVGNIGCHNASCMEGTIVSVAFSYLYHF